MSKGARFSSAAERKPHRQMREGGRACRYLPQSTLSKSGRRCCSQFQRRHFAEPKARTLLVKPERRYWPSNGGRFRHRHLRIKRTTADGGRSAGNESGPHFFEPGAREAVDKGVAMASADGDVHLRSADVLIYHMLTARYRPVRLGMFFAILLMQSLLLIPFSESTVLFSIWLHHHSVLAARGKSLPMR